MINAENAAYHSDKFMTMAKRTRHEYLKDLATNYLTETTLDTPPKFCESYAPRVLPLGCFRSCQM